MNFKKYIISWGEWGEKGGEIPWKYYLEIGVDLL